ncbi:MAG: NADase-type glycan-binding domain-containing protein [Bacteroidota bacterium]
MNWIKILLCVIIFPLYSPSFAKIKAAGVNLKHVEYLQRKIVVQEKEEKWEEMYFRAIRINGVTHHFIVSSELEAVNPYEGLGRYGGHNLFDNDPATAWVEGVKGHGKGEYIIVKAGEIFPDTLAISNGYQKSERLYIMNSRPHHVKLSLYAGFFLEGDDTEIASRYRLKQIGGPVNIELKDKMGFQKLRMPFDRDNAIAARDSLKKAFKKEFADEILQRKEWCPTCDMEPQFSFFVKIEIVNVYRGSEWDDTCISGLSFIYKPNLYTKRRIDKNEDIINVYEDEEPDAGKIYFDTDRFKKLLLVDKTRLDEYKNLGHDEHMSIILMDVSPDKEWAQVDLIFYKEGGDRVEEYSILYNVRMQKRVDEDILDIKYGMFGFVEEKGKIWLDTTEGYIDLDEVREEMR